MIFYVIYVFLQFAREYSGFDGVFLQLTRSRLHILVELKKLVRFMLKAHFNVILISNFVTIFYTIILQFYFSFSRQSYFQGLL